MIKEDSEDPGEEEDKDDEEEEEEKQEKEGKRENKVVESSMWTQTAGRGSVAKCWVGSSSLESEWLVHGPVPSRG